MDKSANISVQLREGLRRLAKAVVIVTARDETQRYAMAATAVSELSLDPPSLLVCVNRSAAIHSVLAGGAHFCVNILHASQEEISIACGGQERGELRFQYGIWSADGEGLPYLQDAQASFICRNERAIAYGTHTIFIGGVIEVRTSGPVDPLVYVDGGYSALARKP